MAGQNDAHLPFEQAYYPGGPLTIAFESAQVTYTDFEVDLYNSGVNQILSVAAGREHRLLHFSMADLHDRGGEYATEAAILELDPAWERAEPLHAHRHLRVVEHAHRPAERRCSSSSCAATTSATERTANIEILQWAAAHAKVLETVEATLSTTDKYAPVERGPQLPHPVTFLRRDDWGRRSRRSSASRVRSPTSCSRIATATAAAPTSTGSPSATPALEDEVAGHHRGLRPRPDPGVSAPRSATETLS